MLFVGALVVARGIGSEFMPALNEGDLMFMPIADPSISLDENTKIAARQNEILMSFPEVEYAVAKVARADTSTDPAPLNMTETVVHLKPRDQWRDGMTVDRLRAEMGRAVHGRPLVWTGPGRGGLRERQRVGQAGISQTLSNRKICSTDSGRGMTLYTLTG